MITSDDFFKISLWVDDVTLTITSDRLLQIFMKNAKFSTIPNGIPNNPPTLASFQ